MKYSFVFAAMLAILALGPLESRAQEASLTSQLSVCKKGAEPPRGVVLVSPEAPHNPIKVFCADELKRFDCQTLSQIVSYINYSYGGCGNNSDMFIQTFGRPACSQLNNKEIAAFNLKVYQAMPVEVKPFFLTLRRTEYEKGCLPPNITPPDY